MNFEVFQHKVKARTLAAIKLLTTPEADIEPKVWHYFEGESLRDMPAPITAQDDMHMTVLNVLRAANRMIQPDFMAVQFTGYQHYSFDPRDLNPVQRSQVRRNRVPDGYVGPSKHPDRQEVVMVHCLRPGEAVMWTIQLERHLDRPPDFGEWGQTEVKGGRMADVMANMMVR